MISRKVQEEFSCGVDNVNEEDWIIQEPTGTVDGHKSVQSAPRQSSTEVHTYAIQCNICFKWRIIPSKKMYEALGEHILEMPFICAYGQEWQENANCNDPTDLDDNEPTVLWAIYKHNIPCPPKGFYRKVVLQTKDPAKKFADIYYTTPCGKNLRSMVDTRKYLEEHPKLGAKISQFSFTSPKGEAEMSTNN